MRWVICGVSAGFKNDNYGAFCLKGKDGEESIEVHYYSVYGTLDLSLLKKPAVMLSMGESYTVRNTRLMQAADIMFLFRGCISFKL
jgi:hypothetical protein